MNKLLYFINMKEEKLKILYPFQYYTFKNISIIKPYLDKYMFNVEHENELFIGNINGLLTMGDMLPNKMLKYFASNKNHKATFVLPENYTETIDKLIGFREQVLKIIDYYKDSQIYIITYKVDNSDIINKIKDLENMKFDVCIGNPPFSGKGNPLYLQILEKCNVIAKNIVWICPSQWVKNYKDSSYLTNVKNNTCKNLISHEHISNPFNDAAVANEIGIYVFGNADQYEDYEKIRLERFKNTILAKSIWKKFEDYVDNIEKHDKIDLNKSYYVRAQWIRGHFLNGKPMWDWTTLFGKDQKINFSFKPTDNTNYWNFDTEIECLNFIKSTETDICMFAHFIGKVNCNNNNQTLELIPWFSDYTHEWTEDMIAQELGLTGVEVDYIHTEMKDFGWKAAIKK